MTGWCHASWLPHKLTMLMRHFAVRILRWYLHLVTRDVNDTVCDELVCTVSNCGMPASWWLIYFKNISHTHVTAILFSSPSLSSSFLHSDNTTPAYLRLCSFCERHAYSMHVKSAQDDSNDWTGDQLTRIFINLFMNLHTAQAICLLNNVKPPSMLPALIAPSSFVKSTGLRKAVGHLFKLQIVLLHFAFPPPWTLRVQKSNWGSRGGGSWHKTESQNSN